MPSACVLVEVLAQTHLPRWLLPALHRKILWRCQTAELDKALRSTAGLCFLASATAMTTKTKKWQRSGSEWARGGRVEAVRSAMTNRLVKFLLRTSRWITVKHSTHRIAQPLPYAAGSESLLFVQHCILWRTDD